jgi:hypothetical protein
MNPIFRSIRPVGQKSIVREWVASLPARMQGTLLTAIRGADTSPREAAVKTLARMYRATVIHGLNDEPLTFLMIIDYDHEGFRREVQAMMNAVASDHDALPHHYLMHLIHAAQIVGEFHPHFHCRAMWAGFYVRMCRKMHMTPETLAELRARLEEPNETSFANAQ